MFRKRVLRKMLELNRDEATGIWDTQHIDILNSSPNIIVTNMSTSVKFTGQAPCRRQKKTAHEIFVETPVLGGFAKL
jgi:hypothetical protein